MLQGIRIIDMTTIVFGPYATRLLADMGAEIIRIDRIVPSDSGVQLEKRFNLLHRGRKSIAMDLKRPEAVEAGTVKLVGTDVDRIVAEAGDLLTDAAAYQRMSRAINPYGDGKACERIVGILAKAPIS